QIIRAERTGNLAQSLLSLTKIFGQELARACEGQLRVAMVKMLLSLAQCIEVATTGAETAFRGLVVAHTGFQVLTKHLKTLTRTRREAKHGLPVRAGREPNGFAGEIGLVADQRRPKRIGLGL